MARQCKNCGSVIYLASLTEINGIKFLKCPVCWTKVRFRKEKEDYLNDSYTKKYRPLQAVCS